jgi:hypothetical protein
MNIEVGQIYERVEPLRGSMYRRFEVLATDSTGSGDPEAWIKWLDVDGSTIAREEMAHKYLEREFKLVVPFFEVGKTYVFAQGVTGHLRYRVRRVEEFGGVKNAILERYNNGEPDRLVALSQESFPSYMEI